MDMVSVRKRVLLFSVTKTHHDEALQGQGSRRKNDSRGRTLYQQLLGEYGNLVVGRTVVSEIVVITYQYGRKTNVDDRLPSRAKCKQTQVDRSSSGSMLVFLQVLSVIFNEHTYMLFQEYVETCLFT